MDGQSLGAGSRVDTSTAHPARRYDYWLGGKDNFAADRESGDAIADAFPSIKIWAIENRRFLRRVVTYLAGEAGIRQFLDIGTGIPAADNTHEVAQGIAPESRVVYADNDPIVLAHARALLTSTSAGATAYLDADLRNPASILDAPELSSVLDLGKPVALMLIAVAHFIQDSEHDPYALVRQLVEALPSGSYLAMSHITNDYLPPQTEDELLEISRRDPFQMRTKTEFGRFFDGLEVIEPGIVPISQWRDADEAAPRPDPAQVGCYGAVARIP